MEEKNRDSNRRSFIRRALGFGAAAGTATLLLRRDKSLIPLAQAGSGSGATVNIDEVNYGVGATEIQSNAAAGAALRGYASANSGTTYGVHGRSDSSDGTGVYGNATATSGTTYGVHGKSNSPEGKAIYGWAAASSGDAYGVYGKSDSADGRGVYGWATSAKGTNHGVYGRSNSTDGVGVYGYASATSGITDGVYGQSDSTDGAGVFGIASASSGITYGLYGVSNSTSGVGILGMVSVASARPMVARGASGQTANLQEWQDISGTALSAIDKNGRLGIGTSSPSFMLHIISGVTGPLTAASAPGAGPAPNSFIVENLTSGNAKSQFTFRASGANKYSFGNDIAGNGGQNFFIWDEVAAAARLFIDSSGNIGIGTLSPESKLHIDFGATGTTKAGTPLGSGPGWIFFAPNGHRRDIVSANWGIAIAASSTSGAPNQNMFRIDENGNVGIGIAPTEKLHVNGNVKAASFITGDIVMSNDYKVTEDENDGVAFLNPKGEKIAVLDSEGNWHIKGRILEDL